MIRSIKIFLLATLVVCSFLTIYMLGVSDGEMDDTFFIAIIFQISACILLILAFIWLYEKREKISDFISKTFSKLSRKT